MEKWLLNKNKGFTLVELLAIIVILAIIALITVPIITNIVKESEKNALKETGRQIIRAGETYRTMSQVKGNQLNGCVYFDFSLSIENETIIDEKKYVPLKELNLQGKLPNKGNLEVCSDTINLNAGNGKYIVTGTKIDDVQVIEDDSETTDTTAPIISQVVLNSTTNSIKVIISAYEEEGTIEKYLYSIDGINYIQEDVNTYTFEGLESNKEYTVYVKVVNKVGLEATLDKTVTTKTVDAPTVTYINTPNEVQNGYLKEQKINIAFNSTNLDYYVKTTRVGTSNIGVTSSCGNKAIPETCTDITSTITLEAGIWYKVSGDIKVTYNTTSTETGTLYAMTYDGINYSEASTGTISKIDRTGPDVELGTATSTTSSIIIPITKMEDTESGLSTPTCKYGTTSGTYNTNGTITSSSCILSGLTSGTTYYYEICVNDLVGNDATCKTGSVEAGTISTSITYINTPSEAQNGYLKEQTIKVTFNSKNITSPSYYIKTTKAGVSNIGVTSSCGTGATIGTCTNITSTTTLSANTWYKVSGDIKVTYNTTSTETGTLYAMTYDGSNYSEASTGTISKIDKASPDVELGTATSTINSITIPITKMEDTQSNISTYTCKYGITEGVYNINAESVTTSSCALTGLTSGTTYYYQICVSDNVGNTVTCKIGSMKTESKQLYSNGEVVYFNPTIGSKCSDYTESQSNVGVNSGCMKWYAINDIESSKTVTLLLDHNTSNLELTGSMDASSLVDSLVNQLKSDSVNWIGVEKQPTVSLKMHGSSSSCPIQLDYSLNYNGSNARLLLDSELEYIEEDDEYITYYKDKNYWLGNTNCSYGSDGVYHFYAWQIFAISDNTDFSNGGPVENGIRPVIEVLKCKL